MAKKTRQVKPDCVRCVHHYGLYEIGADGKPFMCRCRIRSERSRFTTADGCEHYKQQNG